MNEKYDITIYALYYILYWIKYVKLGIRMKNIFVMYLAN